MSLAARYQDGPPIDTRCSICVFELWLAEHHPDDIAAHQAMYDDLRWSDRLHAEALSTEYTREVSAQQLGVHRRGHR
jgi:hypothetical protein